MTYKIALASNSPRRKQLLALGGWQFKLIPADIDETPHPGEFPAEYALRLAREKACCAAERAEAEEVIIAADTIVIDGEAILGKPRDTADAFAMLRRLRARVHHVYTALALRRSSDNAVLSDFFATEVPMRAYTEAEIEAYIASGDPMDKAGAYAIQHRGFNPVASLQGCYANVMGLPLCHLARSLRCLGISPITNIAQACQETLQYACPVYLQVLA